MGGRFLMLNEGFGYRPIMYVKAIQYTPQLDSRAAFTTIKGDQAMFDNNENVTGFKTFLRNYFGKRGPWDQMALTTEETSEQLFALYPRMPIRLILEQQLTLIDAGRDPITGQYWVCFDGEVALFSQPDWWVDDGSGEFVNYWTT